MELDWSVDREGDASLVSCRVRNDGAVPRRVRVESRLDGAVLPPRRGGVPEPGWDAAGVTAVLAPGERRAFGFASVAEPVEPPVAVASAEPVEPGSEAEAGAADGVGDPVRTAVRDLGSPRPPRRAVDGAVPSETPTRANDPEATPERNREDNADDERTISPADPVGAPAGLDAWFAAVEARIERAERLTDADLATATAVVSAAGGLDGVAALDERVASDAERLRALRDRAAALADRAGETDAPTAALERLA